MNYQPIKNQIVTDPTHVIPKSKQYDFRMITAIYLGVADYLLGIG